jgi:hypothetical protein
MPTRFGFVLFSLVAGCADGGLRSGAQESLASPPADEVIVEGSLAIEEPTVLFRCEEGKLGAYVVTGDSEGEPAEVQMVRIDLDSVPDC